MAVASKSNVSNRQRQNTSTRSVVNRSVAIATETRRLPQQSHLKSKTVSLPISRQPSWLLRLLVWQRRSRVIMLMLITAALLLYSWTTHSQRNQHEADKQLAVLQGREQKLAIANEELKHDSAQQAEQSNTDLEPSVPDQTIFLQPSLEPAQQKTSSPAASNSTQKPQPRPNPVGY